MLNEFSPYIGGNEVNTSPTQDAHRYVINFDDMEEDESRRWPDLMAILESKVKPERLKQKDELGRFFWWRFLRPRPALSRALNFVQKETLVISRISPHATLTFVPKNMVFSEQLIVFPIEKKSALAILQSRIHELWARFFSGTALELLRYSPSDCFETFPFPASWEDHAELENIGKTYYEYRAQLMIDNNEGLTTTYNRFHDPDERDAGILKLRELHEAMDKAVLSAYGWLSIPTVCEFILDYEIDEETWPARKKKPYRLRWPDEVRDEVLARLLDLNQKRFEAEQLAGKSAECQQNKHGRQTGSAQRTDPAQNRGPQKKTGSRPGEPV